MRMTRWFVLAFLCTLPLLAADFGGKWTADVPSRGGETTPTTFNLKVDGDKVTGTMSTQRGEAQIADGKVSGDTISFKVSTQGNNRQMVILFEGKASGSDIKFTRKREGGNRTSEFTAKRAAT